MYHLYIYIYMRIPEEFATNVQQVANSNLLALSRIDGTRSHCFARFEWAIPAHKVLGGMPNNPTTSTHVHVYIHRMPFKFFWIMLQTLYAIQFMLSLSLPQLTGRVHHASLRPNAKTIWNTAQHWKKKWWAGARLICGIAHRRGRSGEGTRDDRSR